MRVRDRDINKAIEDILKTVREEFGMKHATKQDLIRHLLIMKKQKKKPFWERLAE